MGFARKRPRSNTLLDGFISASHAFRELLLSAGCKTRRVAMPPAESLLLIDAMALAYRSFHAIPTLTARNGTPTNALLGFAKAVRQLQERLNPTHQAAVFDGGLPVARTIALPTYKAQREPMPHALLQQLPIIEEFLDAASIPRLRMEAQEADDVMATLAQMAESRGFNVFMATNDKDLFQLVSDRVKVVTPNKDGAVMGPAEVVAKTGVAPRQVPAWLALTGDAVDNIPGVPGIGPKTAARLLGQYGSLEGIYSALDQVPGDKLRDALRAAQDDVQRNLALVTLDHQVPGVPDLDALRVTPVQADRMRSFFERLDMPSLAATWQRTHQLELL